MTTPKPSIRARVRHRLIWATVTVLRALKVRFLRVSHPERIGHLALDIDTFLKDRKLGHHRISWVILLCPAGRAANATLLDYWRRYITVVTSPSWCRWLEPLSVPLAFFTHPYTVAIDATADYHRVQAEWGDRPPLLSLSAADRTAGEAALRTLGVPEGAWYVCFHSREGGYSPGDEHLHSYRNSSIDAYLPAVREIVARGGWCIRMGDPTMKRLEPMPGLVDYAHSPLRSPRLDIFLCASCRFFLGNSSGLIFVSGAFGVPVAQANALPVSSTTPFSARDIGIPKLLWSESERRHLSFAEILGSPVGGYRFSSQYAENNLKVEDNSPEDIRALAMEMLERTGGTPPGPSADDEARQARFRSLMRPGHYAYGSASRVGRDFLAKYEHLLSDKR